ncbi:unnamed protein product [Triticum turgidum subsp. durum]|uniref:Anaphase-promoting complex subunit 4 WD40 domain-containing protein n=1 Tax=Triticum turgidum subsp. durum TaxID=4567 RepID=A0A9R1C5A8_TRITD|nr:unnamed protein product [Triticum turgidum subsp. durum]
MLCSFLPSGKIQRAASLSSNQIEAPRRPAFVSLRLPPDGGRGGGSEGSQLPLPSPHHSSASSPRRRIRMEAAVAGHDDSMDRSSAPFSPFTEKLDWAGGAGSPTPKKAPRKVPKTPHKVLDAPSLQDDFYLNLVDWSSQNMLAVGLGTCVYLWSASSCKVTKLCDLGPRDSVCAVHWTREGSYLAVDTNLLNTIHFSSAI